MTKSQSATLDFDAQQAQLNLRGAFIIATIPALQKQAAAIVWPDNLTALAINTAKLSALDSAGAWFLLQLQQQLAARHITLKLDQLSADYQALLSLVSEQTEQMLAFTPPKKVAWFERLGIRAYKILIQIQLFFAFLGEVTLLCASWVRHPSRIQWRLLLNIVETSGYRAIPITGLLAFLIGIVLTYQMGLQLRNYGANIYIVNLVGLAVLREFSPLMTAIIIAGRSGSAFAAQLGTMKVNQEMDALLTMGISPVERLVLQRVLGLLIAVPLLTVWTDIMGIWGSMVMSHQMLGINYYDFVLRFGEVMEAKTFLIGILKAPVFAIIIANIGCFQGFQVTGSATSVGELTTRSVVQAIFLIICADAFFSILLSWYGI